MLNTLPKLKISSSAEKSDTYKPTAESKYEDRVADRYANAAADDDPL